jgi:hypothetical protein
MVVNYKVFIAACLFGLIAIPACYAQKSLAALNIDEIHVVNGMGWGFPISETSQVLGPKYSTSLGLDVTMQNKKFFLYPALDFLSFKYTQLLPDDHSDYLIDNGTSSFLQLNLMAGSKKKLNNWGIYGYGGPLMGFVSEPKAQLSSADQITLKNNYHFTGGVRIGGGTEYKLGSVYLFLDLSYYHNFSTIQGKRVHAITGYGGLKTNITRVADKVIEIISEQTQSP